MLIYLAVTGRSHSRDALAELLWADTPTTMRANLKRVLSNLRNLDGVVLREEGQQLVALDRQHTWVDVVEFAQLAAAPTSDVAALQHAVQLYQGEFLAGFPISISYEFEAWVLAEQAQLKGQLVTLLRRLADEYAQVNDLPQAIATVRRLLQLEPWQEAAHRQLITLLAQHGEVGAALAHFETCRAQLRDELEVEPAAATLELVAQIRAGTFRSQGQQYAASLSVAPLPIAPDHLPSTTNGYITGKEVTTDLRPIRLEPPSHNLPLASTPFVGRGAELADLADLIAKPECRLVTLTGPGGSGKTRLAIEAARQVYSTFVDGVTFVALADVETPGAMLSAIADALDLPDRGDVDTDRLLYNALRAKNMLLVMDNLEHLIEGVNSLSALLQEGPHLTILVTSQERLNLVEEWLYPLEGLSYPPPELSAPTAEYEAVALFMQCARKGRTDFNLESEWRHVASICQRVEGLPLGIELAAGWLRVMSCAEIADQLAQDADFPTSPLRNLPTHHRSLHALFERSWQLLTPEEQLVLCQLAVFRSGFDRRAAETVAGATLALLAAMVNKSLIRRQPTGRFTMHGLVHQFAAEKLADAPHLQNLVRARHAEYYADLASHTGWELESGENAAIEVFPSEVPNMLVAWRWATDYQAVSMLRRMVKPLANYFYYAGWPGDALCAFTTVVEAVRATASSAEQAGLLGSLLLRVGKAYPSHRLQERHTTLSEAVRLLEQTAPRDELELGLAYGEFALVNASLGDHQAATALLEKGLALFQAAGSALGEGQTLIKLGLLKFGRGQAQAATLHFESAMRQLEGIDKDAVMRCTHLLGGVSTMRGLYQRAETLLQQALTFAEDNGRTLRAGSIIRELAELYTLTGNFPKARHCYQEAYACLEPLNLRVDVLIGGVVLSPGVLARLCGDPDAEQLLVETMTAARQVGFRQRLATALHHLSRLRHDQREFENALALLDEALAVARAIDFRYATALVLVQQGHSSIALGLSEQARRCYVEALQIASAEGLDRLALDALCGVATLLEQAEDIEGATILLRLAHAHPASEYETRHRAAAHLVRMGKVESAASIEEESVVDHAYRLAEAVMGARQWLC